MQKVLKIWSLLVCLSVLVALKITKVDISCIITCDSGPYCSNFITCIRIYNAKKKKSWSREILIQKAPLPLVHSRSVSYGRFKRRLVDFLSISTRWISTRSRGLWPLLGEDIFINFSANEEKFLVNQAYFLCQFEVVLAGISEYEKGVVLVYLHLIAVRVHREVFLVPIPSKSQNLILGLSGWSYGFGSLLHSVTPTLAAFSSKSLILKKKTKKKPRRVKKLVPGTTYVSLHCSYLCEGRGSLI